LLAPSGVSLERLAAMPHGISVPRAPLRYRKFADIDETRGAPRGFATPTRKVEIFALRFADHGLPALPVYVEPALSPLSRLGLAGFDPFSDAGANQNLLVLNDVHDPVSGGTPHRSTLCRVQPL